MIAAAVVQTFFEDFAVLAGWDIRARIAVLFAGAAFDLFFTVEFLSRLYGALASGRTRHYLIGERRWVDFAASVPPLMLASGPVILAFYAGAPAATGVAGAVTLLRLAHALRLARVLRLAPVSGYAGGLDMIKFIAVPVVVSVKMGLDFLK